MTLHKILQWLSHPVIIAALLLLAVLAPVQAQEMPSFNLLIKNKGLGAHALGIGIGLALLLAWLAHSALVLIGRRRSSHA